MPGFDPLTLSTAYILASLSTACPAQGHVPVNVNVVQADNPVVTGVPAAEMRDKRVDMDSSGVTDGGWMKGGATLTRGMALKEGIDVEFSAPPPQDGTSACLTLKQVNYTVTFSPTVYIAEGLSPCVSKATLAHEQRHVDHDRAVIEAWVPLIEKALTEYIDKLPAQGPVNMASAESMKDQLTNDIMQAIKPKWGNLSYAVRKGQADVDTPEDYKKDTAACPGEFPPFEAAK